MSSKIDYYFDNKYLCSTNSYSSLYWERTGLFDRYKTILIENSHGCSNNTLNKMQNVVDNPKKLKVYWSKG